ncbi:MAG: hypothetical protein HYZ38_24210 [Mycobacterium sp.]|nr:hypothetical protein [Mycobacterium sp.]
MKIHSIPRLSKIMGMAALSGGVALAGLGFAGGVANAAPPPPPPPGQCVPLPLKPCPPNPAPPPPPPGR